MPNIKVYHFLEIYLSYIRNCDNQIVLSTHQIKGLPQKMRFYIFYDSRICITEVDRKW